MPICQISGATFSISAFEQEFCRTHELPLPVVCPTERLKDILVLRNRLHLFNGVCAHSNKKIFTCIDPDKGFRVYDSDVWESDAWDGKTFGREYDFNRPFFEQFYELLRVVPLPSLAVLRSTMENSDYANGITGAKNCYLVFGASYNEDCLFCRNINYNKNLVDCFMAEKCELCFDCRNIQNCYNLKFSGECITCSDSAFLFGCTSCTNCYGCVNLTNKQYHFFNEPLTASEYEQRIGALDFGSYLTVIVEKKRFAEFARDFPIRFQVGRNNEDSSGDYLYNTKHCTNCRFVNSAEEMEYCIWINSGKSSLFQCMYGNNSEVIYNSHATGDNTYNIKFCNDCWQGSHDLEYCMYTSYGSGYCFGCVGLKKQSYCVLNKQYSKDEYLSLTKRIKTQMRSSGEYGRFFPNYYSLHDYNVSEANDFFPISQTQALSEGYTWRDDEELTRETGKALPDHIRDVGEEILATPLACELTGKRYKIIKQELDYYRRANLPLPRVAPLERLKLNSVQFRWKPLLPTNCANCGSMFESVYAASSQRVFCEQCFQQTRV